MIKESIDRDVLRQAVRADPRRKSDILRARGTLTKWESWQTELSALMESRH